MKFTKPPLQIADQIQLLKSRGMIVPDNDRAEHYLQHISYYRLRAYWLPFELGDPNHSFRSGTSIEQAIELYIFDRQLRLLVMDAIERIEISIRGSWAHHLAIAHGSHGYLNPALYDRSDFFETSMANLEEEVRRSKDTFIEHYRTKYCDPPLPPIWMAAEILTLGQLSKWLGNLKRRGDRKAIAKPYGLDESILISVAHHLAIVRNICAHHGRLWNRRFTVTMRIPSHPAPLHQSMGVGSTKKLYNTLVMIGFLMDIVAPNSKWRDRILSLLEEYPDLPLNAVGFPSNWKSLPMWRLV